VRISAKADYAMRALLELAAKDEPLVKGDDIAEAQGIPIKFLEKIMSELKTAGIVGSQRGAEGGYSLIRPPAEVKLADVMRAIDGPIAIVRDTRPENLDYAGAAKGLRSAWVALRSSMRVVLESVTLADVLAEEFPPEVAEMLADPEAWESD
jgi:Rrf2 family protein